MSLETADRTEQTQSMDVNKGEQSVEVLQHFPSSPASAADQQQKLMDMMHCALHGATSLMLYIHTKQWSYTPQGSVIIYIFLDNGTPAKNSTETSCFSLTPNSFLPRDHLPSLEGVCPLWLLYCFFFLPEGLSSIYQPLMKKTTYNHMEHKHLSSQRKKSKTKTTFICTYTTGMNTFSPSNPTDSGHCTSCISLQKQVSSYISGRSI